VAATTAGAQVLLENLRWHDVEIVFGLPSVHNLSSWEVLKTTGLRMIGVRHERTAA